MRSLQSCAWLCLMGRRSTALREGASFLLWQLKSRCLKRLTTRRTMEVEPIHNNNNGNKWRAAPVPQLTSKQTARFWSFVNIPPGEEDKCWKWLGHKNGSGYGNISLFNRKYPVHRIALALVGRVPDVKLHVDHICRNRSCVNPKHLREVPGKINLLAGEGCCASNAQKDKCANGHFYTEENTIWMKRRNRAAQRYERRCRKCWNAYQNKRYREKRAGR